MDSAKTRPRTSSKAINSCPRGRNCEAWFSTTRRARSKVRTPEACGETAIRKMIGGNITKAKPQFILQKPASWPAHSDQSHARGRFRAKQGQNAPAFQSLYPTQRTSADCPRPVADDQVLSNLISALRKPQSDDCFH